MESLEYERMDQVEGQLWWYRALHERLIAALTDVRGEVLDAGCGTGGFLKTLAARRPDLTLTGCEWNFVAATLARRKGAAAVVGSVNVLPFPDGTFDAVVCADVLCHEAVQPAAALGEMRRVLRTGGRLIVNMPAYMWLFSEHDRRVRSARRVNAGQMQAMLREAGFATEKIRYWNGFLLPLMIVRRKLLARHEGAQSDVAPVNGMLNACFLAVLKLERHVSVPAGGSVMAVAVCP